MRREVISSSVQTQKAPSFFCFEDVRGNESASSAQKNPPSLEEEKMEMERNRERTMYVYYALN